jgi:NAD(P)-dependent dehydrogenase (short-subunit alcohol dehydrogenase family)
VKLDGKVAVVTGAAGGIGLATARAMVAAGGSVVLGDVDEARVVAAAASLGERARGVVADVTDEASVEALVGTAVSAFGRLDVLHNNAVVSTPDDRDALTTSDEVWRSTFDVVVMAAVYGARHAIPAMRATGGGSIITMSSGAAHAAAGRIAYGSMKAAIETFSLYVAAEHGRDGIRSNVVAPGFVLTDSVRAGFADEQVAGIEAGLAAPRICTPEDVADVVVYLASDASAYVSGQVLRVNGGGMRATRF